MKKILDIKITRDRKRRTIHMNQSHYLNEIFDELHMIADKYIQTTLFMNEYDFLCSVESDDERINSKNYQHKIGKFMYAVIHTRSDIVFAIERFNQYFSDSAIHHEQALIILLQYVRFTIDLGIVYETKLNVNKSSNNNKNSKLKAFSDSDYAADKLNRKSIFEYVYMFAEKLIT